MRILLVITGMGMGGAERQVIALSNKFIEFGHDVKIISLLDNNKFPEEYFRSIQLITLGLNKNFLGLLKAIKKFYIEYKLFNPEIIHSHMYHANIFTRILKIIINFPPLINTIHSTNEGGFLRMFIYRLTDSLATITTTVSKTATLKYLNLKISTRNKLITIYNGIDTDYFSPNIEEAKKFKNINYPDLYIVLAVGRLVVEKDYPTLVNAFYRFQKVIKNSKLLIIGDGPQRSNIMELIENLGLNNNIELLGLKYDIYDYLNLCNQFAISSKYEGFGISIAEAMAMKKFVIATDCGGSNDVLGSCGAIVPIGDVDAFANKMIEVALSSYDLIKINGINSRKRVIDNFSLKKISNDWMQLYKGLIID